MVSKRYNVQHKCRLKMFYVDLNFLPIGSTVKLYIHSSLLLSTLLSSHMYNEIIPSLHSGCEELPGATPVYRQGYAFTTFCPTAYEAKC